MGNHVSTTALSRRNLLAASATGLLATGVAGCAAGTKTTPAATETTTATTTETSTAGGAASGASSSGTGAKVTGGVLSILTYASDVPKEQIQQFQKDHQCQVKIEEYSFDKLTAMLASNRAPDVVMGDGGLDTPYLATKGLAEPIDDRLAASTTLKADDLADINNLWRYEGNTQGKGPIYGLVKDYSNDLTLWVNSTLLGAVPKEGEVWTYDQLRDTALKTTKQSSGRVESYGYEFYDDKLHMMHLESMMQSAGATLFNEDQSQVDFTKAESVKALDYFRAMIEAKATTSSFSKSSANTWQLFQAGRLAILQSGYWTQGMFGDYKDNVKNNLYMLPAPQMGSNRISPVLAGRGFWIPKQAKNKDLAWAWMEYFFGGQPAADRAASGWGVPALKSLESKMPNETPLNKRALACEQEEMKHFKTMTFTPYARVTACNTLLLTAMENGIKGKKATTDIAADMNKSINALLTRGKR